MSQCSWQPDGEGVRCKQCGVRRAMPVVRNCVAKRPKIARHPKRPTPKQAVNYAKAVAKWTVAGSPTRSEAEIDRLLAICQTCPHDLYRISDAGEGYCESCGCGLNKKLSGYKNKLAMQTEHCPKGEW